MRFLLAALLFALLQPLGAWAEAPRTAELSRALDLAVDSALQDQRVAGCVVMVAHKGQLVYRRAAGLADLDSQRPMHENTLFRLASVTKPMVTAAAMKLIEQGRLATTDPVSKWLPSFQPALPDGSRPEMTIHHLLTHTSGLTYRFAQPPGGPYERLDISDGLDHPERSLADNLSLLAQAPLEKEPGTGFIYSLSTDVLGAVIEKATGKPLPEAVEELVLSPLGMSDTGFYAKDTARLATAYSYADQRLQPINDGTGLPLGLGVLVYYPSKGLKPSANPSGGGGMVGSAQDVFRFLETIRQGGGAMLTASTVALMTQDQLPESMQGHRAGWGFGFGWAVLRDPALAKTPQSVGTLQWGGAYGHSWFVDPSQELTVVLLTNTAFEGMSGKLPADLRQAVYDWLR